ncbi:MAG: hypothetical protein V1798_10450 [Pseudomonadota bacterium]
MPLFVLLAPVAPNYAGEVPDKTVATEERLKIDVSVAPFLSYSRMDAEDRSNGAKAAVPSKTNFGGEFKLRETWGTHFSSEAIVQIEEKTYQTKSGRTFSENGGLVFNFGMALGIKPFNRYENLQVIIKALYGDEFYLRAPDITSLAVDSAKSLKADLALHLDVFTSKYASSGLGGGARVIVPTYIDAPGVSYRARTGYGYFGTVYMRHAFKVVTFEESFTYEVDTKNTALFNQTQTAVYFKSELTFHF